ncbi:MAG: histidine kinase N-terminal 7TM domain-containing protein [Anaerolineae bacterium]
MEEISLVVILSLINLILASANVIVAFSLFVYILSHNLYNSVARSFCALVGLVMVVYAGDVILTKVASPPAITFWLKFQWLGIAFVPAAYLHFSDTLLRTTKAFSTWRRRAVFVSYVVSGLFLLLALQTDLIVKGEFSYSSWVPQLSAGSLFWTFAAYFLILSLWGLFNIIRARQRCLTSTTRRRMLYLSGTFAAPGLAVFPYLLLAGLPTRLAPEIILFLSSIGNGIVAVLIVFMAYSVAYHGVLTPDRVVRRNFVKYLIQGPLMGTCVIGLLLVVPRVEQVLGLPRETVLIFATVIGIVLFQIILSLATPLVDLLTYRGDRAEISWLRRLDERLLTTTDLTQLMENILTAICDLLRAEAGFVMVVEGGGQLKFETACGHRALTDSFLTNCDLNELLATLPNEGKASPEWNPSFHNGFWLLPLLNQARDATLGILGVKGPPEGLTLADKEKELVRTLADHAELALEDRHIQQGVFQILKQITPEMEFIQRWRGTAHYAGATTLETIEDNIIHAPNFPQLVKDAFSHYWGGPRLTESPLLRLRVVRKALGSNGHSPAKAMRAVLGQAMEALKPEGQRDLTAPEWVLYNILEMKFIQGRRVRDIAARLAISESDLYRKQRTAIEEVAKMLAGMEERVR